MSDDDKKDDDRTVFQPPPGNKGDAHPAPPPGGSWPASPPPPSPGPPIPTAPATGPAADPFGAPGGGAPPAPAQTPPPPVSPDAFAPMAPEPPQPPVRTAQLAIGDILIETYRITRFIDRGGMGEVYEGVNIHSASERVAIKVILPHLASDELVMAMFAKEATTLTRLHHEAIAPYRNYSKDPQGRPFIVTEFIDGPSLEELLGRMKLADDQFGELTRRLALGLGAAHTLGAIHRDIAPDNVLLVDGDPGRPKIIDFGIARDAREAREQTGTIVGDGFAGKLKYVAPEQLGEYGKRIGPWTDLYSLALTMLAVASGRPADMGGSITDAVKKRMAVPDLSAIPARYRAAFERALQPDPAQRPQSMGDFIALLQQAEERGAGGFMPLDERPRPPAPPAPPAKGGGGGFLARLPDGLPGGKWALIGAAGAVALVAGIVGIVVATSGGEEEPFERTGETEQAAGPAGSVVPGSQEFAALAASLAQEQPCSWLSFDGADARVARFVGGAGNPAGAQSAIADGLAARGADNVSLDMGEVVTFDRSMCAAVDAMREFRSSDDLVTSPQRTYEAEEQELILADGRNLGQGKWAKPLFRVAGLRADEELVFIVIEARDSMQPLFSGRESGKQTVELLSGNANPDGFDVPYPAELELPPKESYGIAVISGKGPFPVALFGDPNDETGDQKVPLDASWPDRFRSEARAKGWRTDIFWFSVADEVPG